MNRNISRSLTMFDLRFSAVTLSQATEEVIGLIGLGRRELVVTPNVDHVVSDRKSVV